MNATFRFRIRRSGAKWRVETWDAEPPYGPGWQPLISGYVSLAEAQVDFPANWRGVVFDDPTRMTGTFPSQGEPA